MALRREQRIPNFEKQKRWQQGSLAGRLSAAAGDQIDVEECLPARMNPSSPLIHNPSTFRNLSLSPRGIMMHHVSMLLAFARVRHLIIRVRGRRKVFHYFDIKAAVALFHIHAYAYLLPTSLAPLPSFSLARSPSMPRSLALALFSLSLSLSRHLPFYNTHNVNRMIG